MTTEPLCGCTHLWEHHQGGACDVNTAQGPCGCVGWKPIGVYVDVLRGYCKALTPSPRDAFFRVLNMNRGSY